MINYLQLKNYRGFENYRLNELGGVNLLVGKNNSGKTSVLEAVNIVATSGDPKILSRIARYRGETIFLPQGDEIPPGGEVFPSIYHFFHGHQAEKNSAFSLSTDQHDISFTILDFGEVEESQQQYLFEDLARVRRSTIKAEATNFRIQYALKIEGNTVPLTATALPVSDEGGLILELTRYGRPSSGWRKEDTSAAQFVTPESLSNLQMAALWDKAIIDGKEQNIINAINILNDNISGIFFLSGERSSRFSSRGGILVGLKDTTKRVPLGSFGEGMRRILALSLALTRLKGGVLLIDEIDTGLHYSIMGDMWWYIVKVAREYDVQVFATTHSFDCVKGLAWFCDSYPELAVDVTLQKVERSINEAVGLKSSEIKLAIEQGWEPR